MRVGPAGELKQAAERGDSGGKSFERANDSSDPFREDGEWVILDMLDDNGEIRTLSLSDRQ